MTKFNVGEKVKFIEDFGDYAKGDVVEVIYLIDDNHIKFKGEHGKGDCYTHRIKKILSKNQRITALENEVAELKLIVHELRGKKLIEPSTTNTVEDIIEFEGEQYRKVDREAQVGDVVIFRKNTSICVDNNKKYIVAKYCGDVAINVETENAPDYYLLYNNDYNRTPETVDVYELIEEGLNPQIPMVDETIEPLTPNQQRAAIIEKAKKFVKNVSSCQSSCVSNEIGNETYQGMCTDNEFIINDEKRTVVVLVRGVRSGQIYEKGIAKCNPSDVFNEHIGKAIALGRALGLDVSEFEQAVQPTVAIGQLLAHKYDRHDQTRWKVDDLNDTGKNLTIIEGDFKSLIGETADGGYLPDETWYRIINDTNAKYEVIK